MTMWLINNRNINKGIRIHILINMFHKTENSKGSFLEQTKAAREERAMEKRKDVAATLIQANIRGWLTRIKFTQNVLWVNSLQFNCTHIISPFLDSTFLNELKL